MYTIILYCKQFVNAKMELKQKPYIFIFDGIFKIIKILIIIELTLNTILLEHEAKAYNSSHKIV